MDTTPTPEKQALQRAAQLLGGQAALATLLGYSDRRNVYPWFATERPFPAEHCPAVERATKGAVTVEELRPNEQWARVKDKAWPHPEGRPVVDFSISKPTAEQVG